MIATYFIASSFMSVYHMAVDTTFICASKHCNIFVLPGGGGGGGGGQCTLSRCWPAYDILLRIHI